MSAAPPVDVDYSKKWLVLATVGSGVVLATIDSSIVNVALPTITGEFDSTFRAIQWIPLAYVLVIASAQVTALRDVFLWAVGIMVVAVVVGVWGLRKERVLLA